ncbi:formate dehydrogenase accessory sulfurtransferase FdhD [uncultured Adlercreutzia sp.]|uniref:formate dehydrogenase accessory sulfurtransferase FdhD n=1 Tax=uncultured Adlercreutzia sp. TaxID=875803 RepID=UPI0025F12CD3|nr:formate dehydrogenase accessory sulfurtransferase FdhD [uncultured Adlercreutzia sp.]MCI9262399.1 formate dehydrogenase accessory sulfurtransferase FdhD [Eggerthellaceae bacterium]
MNTRASDGAVDQASPSSFIHELICRFEEEVGTYQIDTVIEEVVFTILVDGAAVRDMTCSPWHIRELVIGSLYTSGKIDCIEDVASVEVDEEAGEVRVRTVGENSSRPETAGAVVDRVLCPTARPSVSVEPMLTAEEVSTRIGFLEGNSQLFHRTGGVHSAVLVDGEGELVAWFEDIGRHNALDKLAGWCLANHVDASDKILLFSGRVPREIIARAIRIGVPVVISPGAPTNLSIALACEHGITLIGFAKNGKFNVYTHATRIKPAE